MSDFIDGVGQGAGAAAGGAAGVRIARRRAIRLARSNQAEFALRVITGAHDGLSGRWRAGLASLSGGQIQFRP